MKAMSGTIIVEPLYDAGGVVSHDIPYHATDAKIEGHEIHGILMAGTVENPMSQQGVVVESRIDEFAPGMIALYMPFHGHPIRLKGQEYLCIPDRELVGWLIDKDIMPRKGNLLIRPLFPDEKSPSGLLFIPDMGGLHDPITQGVVVRQGAFTTIEVGTHVVIPPHDGFEIGIDENFYVINEQRILATLD